MMREAMNTIIADNTHLTERCEAMLAALDGDLARPLEPSYDELNPPPEPLEGCGPEKERGDAYGHPSE